MPTVEMIVRLDKELVDEARILDKEEINRVVSTALQDRLRSEHSLSLREELIAGCIANAEEDRETCREWEHIDREMWSRIEP